MKIEKGNSGQPLRIVLLGKNGVGKSAITVRFLCGRYLHEYDPNLECCYDKTEIIDGKAVKLEIFDTAGQDSLVNYLENADAVLYVYSILSKESFAAAETFSNDMKLRSPLPVILIGNKRELEQGRQVSYEDGFKLAKESNWKFYELSAAVDTNRINDIVRNLASELIAKKSRRKRKSGKIKLAMSIFTSHITQAKQNLPSRHTLEEKSSSGAMFNHPRLKERRKTFPFLADAI